VERDDDEQEFAVGAAKVAAFESVVEAAKPAAAFR
jgi:hypothetical protein